MCLNIQLVTSIKLVFDTKCLNSYDKVSCWNRIVSIYAEIILFRQFLQLCEFRSGNTSEISSNDITAVEQRYIWHICHIFTSCRYQMRDCLAISPCVFAFNFRFRSRRVGILWFYCLLETLFQYWIGISEIIY